MGDIPKTLALAVWRCTCRNLQLTCMKTSGRWQETFWLFSFSPISGSVTKYVNMSERIQRAAFMLSTVWPDVTAPLHSVQSRKRTCWCPRDVKLQWINLQCDIILRHSCSLGNCFLYHPSIRLLAVFYVAYNHNLPQKRTRRFWFVRLRR